MNPTTMPRGPYTFRGSTLDEALYFVGGFQDFEAKSQPQFCKDRGLAPSDCFLDLGCGCLRGTAPLVDYLWDGNFFGADSSPELLALAAERLKALEIRKTPILKPVDDFDFRKVLPRPFDFILSVSLLTHILPREIPDLFVGVRDILTLGGIWYFTIIPTDSESRGDSNCVIHNKKYLIDCGRDVGLLVEDLPGDYPNPCPNPNNLLPRVNSTLGQWVMKASLI